MWTRLILAFAVSQIAPVGQTHAEELTIFATGSMVDPLKEVGEEFTHATGHTLRFSVGTTSGVLARLEAGEKGDVIVISGTAAATLEQAGTIVPGTRRFVASSLFGVVVKAGAPAPDVATPEALKQTVLRARSIAYPDPVAAAVAGGYVETVFEQLGIKDEAKSKATLKPMGYLVGEAVEKGEVELGLSFISEFAANKALQVVVFPRALQKPQPYLAGVFAGTAHADAARTFIAFVTSPGARDKLKAAGVDPVPAAR